LTFFKSDIKLEELPTDRKVLATLLALCVLEACYEDYESEYSLVARKARAILSKDHKEISVQQITDYLMDYIQ